MSLNELLYHHQLALMRAASATAPGAGRDHRANAADLADRVEALIRRDGATTAPLARA